MIVRGSYRVYKVIMRPLYHLKSRHSYPRRKLRQEGEEDRKKNRCPKEHTLHLMKNLKAMISPISQVQKVIKNSKARTLFLQPLSNKGFKVLSDQKMIETKPVLAMIPSHGPLPKIFQMVKNSLKVMI